MRNGLAILMICLFAAVTAQAQDTTAVSTTATVSSGQQITLQEAIDIALENNFQLKVAENNLELSEYREKSEKADFLPSLNANAQGGKSIGRQFNDNTGEFGDFTVNSFGGGINASIPLFNGFDNINSLRSSQYDTRSQEQTKQRVRETIIFNTASNFLQVILDKELLDIARETLAASEKTLEQVDAQVDVGSRPSVDLYNQEATVANNELQVTNQENALELSRLRLIRQLQVDPVRNYNFVIPDIAVEDVRRENYNLQALVQAALENRSDLKSEQFNIQSIEHQLKATRGTLYPTLNFSASLSSRYNDISQRVVYDEDGNPVPDPNNPGQPLTETIPFNDQFFDQNISRSFSLSLNVPIFNNLNRRTNVQSQKINYKNAKLQLEDTRLQVVQEVTQALNDYKAVVKRLESTEKALRAARRSYETQRERYNVGAGTLIELSDANSQFVEAQSNRAQAVFNFIFQKKLLDYYLGKLNENISLND